MIASEESLLTQQIDIRLIVRQGKIPCEVHGVKGPITVVGKSEVCDLNLDSSRMGGAHTAFIKLGCEAFVCDLGKPGGTTLNDRRIRWARLTNGDEIGIGPFSIKAVIDAPNRSTKSERPIFNLQNEQTIGKITNIDPVLLVGSDPGCDVVLPDKTIAPQHCLIAWTQEGPLLRDLQRDHPTRLNQTTDHNGRLVSGDRLGIGDYELRFETNVSLPMDEKQEAGEDDTALLEFIGSEDPSVIVAGRLPVDVLACTESLWSPFSRSLEGRELPGDREPVESAKSEEVIDSSIDRVDQVGDESHITSGKEVESNQMGEPESEVSEENSMEQQDVGEVSSDKVTPVSSDEILSEKSRELQEKTMEIQARVAAAQRALDERARKYREDLDQERHRLEAHQVDIKRQARIMNEAIRQNLNDGQEKNSSDKHPAKTSQQSQASSHEEGSDAGGAGSMATASSSLLENQLDTAIRNYDGMRSSLDRLSLDKRVTELVDLAKAERKEVEKGDAMIDTLRMEIERLQSSVTQRKNELQTRKRELDESFGALGEACETLQREREPLKSRLMELDAEESTIKARIEDGERMCEELACEAELLNESRQRLSVQKQELYNRLESERQRLQERKTRLQNKASELEQILDGRLSDIEAELTVQQSSLNSSDEQFAPFGRSSGTDQSLTSISTTEEALRGAQERLSALSRIEHQAGEGAGRLNSLREKIKSLVNDDSSFAFNLGSIDSDKKDKATKPGRFKEQTDLSKGLMTGLDERNESLTFDEVGAASDSQAVFDGANCSATHSEQKE